jgi:hypothetical protein
VLGITSEHDDRRHENHHEDENDLETGKVKLGLAKVFDMEDFRKHCFAEGLLTIEEGDDDERQDDPHGRVNVRPPVAEEVGDSDNVGAAKPWNVSCSVKGAPGKEHQGIQLTLLMRRSCSSRWQTQQQDQ